MTETVKIRMVVDTDEASRSTQKFRKDLDKTRGSAEGAKGSFNELSQVLGQFSPMLGRVATTFYKAKDSFVAFQKNVKVDRMRAIANGFYKVNGSLVGVGKAAKGLTSNVTAAMSGLSNGFSAAMAAVNPVLLALVAVGASIMIIKKAWDVMKESFKAFDPEGYAKLFGTFERTLRKLKTAIGYLAKGPVELVMKIAIGFLSYLEDALDVIIQIKNWIDSVASSLGPVTDILGQLVQTMSPFFRMLGIFYDRGSQELENAAETITDATSMGLAGFDKLNNFGQQEGDAEKIEEINKMAENTDLASSMRSALEDIADSIGNYFGGIGRAWDDLTSGARSWVGDVSKGMTEAWDGFTNGATETFSKVKNIVGDTWDNFKTLAEGVWSGFINVATQAFNGIRTLAVSIWTGFVDAATKAVTTIMGIIDRMLEPMREFYNTVTNSTIGKTTETVNTIGKAASGDANAAMSLVAQGAKQTTEGTGVVGLINKVKDLFGFANGGLFMPNTPQLAIFGDNKREPEVAAPYSMIVKAVQEAIGASGSGQGTGKIIQVVVPVEIDGRQVARASYDYIENERNRRNRSGAI